MIRLRVARSRLEAIDIRSFELVDPSGGELPAFTAGSHVDVRVPGGPLRQYSILSDPADRMAYRIGVKREPASRGGSSGMHDRVGEGDLIEVGLPRNNFPLAADAAHSILLAGGIGITPVLSMVRDLHARGRSYELHYFSRSAEHAAFRDELMAGAWRESTHFQLGLGPDEVDACLARILRARAPDAHLYTCGPAVFMAAVRQTAARSWPEEAIHLEHFSPEPDAACAAADAFVVVLASSGREIAVPAGMSIVDALAEAGVEVEVSCEQGICGTCLTGVLAGEPDHRDMFLLDDEKAAGDSMCLCVSRARTPRLVLDL